MSDAKGVTKKQKAVIEDLFAGEAGEQQVLKRHKVSQRLYEKWQTDERFLQAFESRLQRERRQSEMIIARFAETASIKLVELTNSESEETSRKACLDIINLLRPNPEPQPAEQAEPEQPQELPPELAGRLLEALAANGCPKNGK